jgi:class 3 adenylate cyclase
VSANSDPVAVRGLLPSGTVTFAFTDIEGSTRRWEHDRDAMQDAVRRHDALMRAAIGENGGHVFKTIGDAFCAAFSRPEDAVAAMLAAQRALAAEDFGAVDGLRVRVAMHAGTADERDGDYFGPAVNRVARLLAIGHGGQVLVSGVTSDLVQGALPPRASLGDLGEHKLKDLARPEQVYQLLAPDLMAEFPALRSLDVLANNLPPQFASLVGRETEIAEITALIDTHRLVTLVGSGGVGKTRISLQVAANLIDGSGDGVWLIELAPLSSGEYIVPAVAQGLGLTLGSDGDPLDNLVQALKSKRALLVFDNCEHLVEPAGRVIADPCLEPARAWNRRRSDLSDAVAFGSKRCRGCFARGERGGSVPRNRALRRACARRRSELWINRRECASPRRHLPAPGRDSARDRTCGLAYEDV